MNLKAKRVVTGYLNAWENANYERMCLYLEKCGKPTWIRTMSLFPVPVRKWQIRNVEIQGSEVVARYTIKMPTLRYIVRAALDENPKAAASRLEETGTYTTWEDTLRLVKRGDDHKIKSCRKTSEASNRLVSFIQAVGTFLMTAKLFPEEQKLPMVLGFYATELDKSKAEMMRILSET